MSCLLSLTKSPASGEPIPEPSTATALHLHFQFSRRARPRGCHLSPGSPHRCATMACSSVTQALPRRPVPFRTCRLATGKFAQRSHCLALKHSTPTARKTSEKQLPSQKDASSWKPEEELGESESELTPRPLVFAEGPLSFEILSMSPPHGGHRLARCDAAAHPGLKCPSPWRVLFI